ncbi:MAG: bifunctional riboflavin kinase/FMN adenylyltransferase [Chloroflexi bacterium]|nr:MAG: bifunctional riboflavin kinase/FMN adenylyltransferase [Chloroflexota bacterium]
MKQITKQVKLLTEIEEKRPTYLAIGSFDGVHLGHQEVLSQMVMAAKRDGARTAVLTFFPHPKHILKNLTEAYYITTLTDRVRFLGEQGIDLVITHPFDEAVRHTRAADFVEQLIEYVDMRQIWGGNFAFGYKREGDIPFLRKLGAERGFSVELVKAMVEVDGAWVSSSRIRHSLQAGNVAEVNLCLGRPFRVCGEVILGDQRGRTIGFPTANLDAWDELLLPANGVYATYAWVGETRYIAATNVGSRPTVNGRSVTVEAYLLDFKGNLYGQEMCLEFMQHVRSEQKFSSLDALTTQIQLDVAEIRERLADNR